MSDDIELPIYYDPQGKISIAPEEEEDFHPGQEEFIEEKEDCLFHIGQYQSRLAKTAYCKHCGGKEFNVGIEDYYTAIKCVKCEYEFCIHEG